MKVFLGSFFILCNFFSFLECAHFRNIDPKAFRKPPLFKDTFNLPSTEEIKNRLLAIKLEHFVKETHIDKRLGGRKVYPFAVVVNVEMACYEYDQICNNPLLCSIMRMRKSEIIATILSDYPEALVELARENLYFDE